MRKLLRRLAEKVLILPAPARRRCPYCDGIGYTKYWGSYLLVCTSTYPHPPLSRYWDSEALALVASVGWSGPFR